MRQAGAGTRGKPVNAIVISPSKGRYFPQKPRAFLFRTPAFVGSNWELLSAGSRCFCGNRHGLVFAIQLFYFCRAVVQFVTRLIGKDFPCSAVITRNFFPSGVTSYGATSPLTDKMELPSGKSGRAASA